MHTTRLSPNLRRAILKPRAIVGKRYFERLAPLESSAGARASLNWRYGKNLIFRYPHSTRVCFGGQIAYSIQGQSHDFP